MKPSFLQTGLPSIDNLDPSMALALGLFMRPDQIPGQWLDTQNGVVPSAIYNKPASHPDVEAVKGELIYNPKKETHAIDELREEKDKLADTVITMQAQIQALMGMQGAPASVPAKDTVSLADFEAMKAENNRLKANARARASRRGKGKTGKESTTA